MWPFRPKPHRADEYFRYKLAHDRPETDEGWDILLAAKRLRHRYSALSGPELVRLVYWGASGARDEA